MTQPLGAPEKDAEWLELYYPHASASVRDTVRVWLTPRDAEAGRTTTFDDVDRLLVSARGKFECMLKPAPVSDATSPGGGTPGEVGGDDDGDDDDEDGLDFEPGDDCDDDGSESRHVTTQLSHDSISVAWFHICHVTPAMRCDAVRCGAVRCECECE